MQQASAEFGNHALALTILASFLHNAFEGDIRQRKEIGPLTADELNGGHARRVMSSYETWLRDAGEDTLLAVLRVLGLFNRPADAAALAALRAAPAIPDLTEALLPLSEPQWKQMLAKLRRLKLLTDSSTNDEVDAHPLLREHFRDQLQHAHPAAWQAGNLRLYEHLTRTAKEFPDTLEEMQPLFAAVMHGCAAGIQHQVLDAVYLPRIRRGNEAFSRKKLGVLSAELAALSEFFTLMWSTPSSNLTDDAQAFVLNAVGFYLHLLGRTREATQPLTTALNKVKAQADWRNAAQSASNLSDLALTLGDLKQSYEFAKQSIEFADRSGDSLMRVVCRSTLANAFHQAGDLNKSQELFHTAEILQKKWQPEFPILYSSRGFLYCEALLSKGRVREVLLRINKTLKWSKGNDGYSLLAFALDQLVLGRVHFRLAVQTKTNLKRAPKGHLSQSLYHLNRAVAGLQQSEHSQYQPFGLLARAALARVAEQFDQAHRDLAEALAIAERGAMRLHLCDYHLESGRLHLAQGHTDEARSYWETARKMVEEMGYHRRDAEVAELAQQLTASE